MRLARAVVWLRYVSVAGWIGGAVAAVLLLPSIGSGGGGSLGGLVPKNAPALHAQEVSVRDFAFPVLSQTVIVVRNPHGLPARRQAQLVSLAVRLSRRQVPGFDSVEGALPLVNTLGIAPFSRQHGTTLLLYLFFSPSLDAYERTMGARRLLADEVGHARGEFEGVTGQAPGEVARTALISDHLGWVELATILLVAVAIALHFRAPGAALLAIVTVAIAYLLADRLVAKFGAASGISVPAEVQPVLVVLVFGVVTDYSIFFLSRFRALLREGVARREAAVTIVHQISPIVLVAGVTVAAGTAALLVAHLDFLRAFGPGLAISVLIAMLVAVTFVPAVLGVCGRALLWPALRHAEAAPADVAGSPAAVDGSRRLWTVRQAVRHPILAVVLAVAVVLGAARGLLRIALGNELILGLPAGSSAHAAFAQASRGFAPGVLAPAVVVVLGNGVGEQRAGLRRLQGLLARERDVAEVLGPAQNLASGRFGATIAQSGNAARYALFLASDPLGARAIAEARRLVDRMPSLLAQAGVRGARGLVAGDSALSADTVNDTLADLSRVTPAVLLAIFVVVSIFLRALVAPVYLVLTSALSAFAALGLVVYVMQIWLGYGQITYYVVFVASVLLVSLGSDYNVFLVGRIWQEGRRRPLREAVEVAGTSAARPITVAGFVLALSFALLAIVPVRAFREIAFTVAAGLLIDSLVVRTVLVPALVSLVGRVSAWPGNGLRGDRG